MSRRRPVPSGLAVQMVPFRSKAMRQDQLGDPEWRRKPSLRADDDGQCDEQGDENGGIMPTSTATFISRAAPLGAHVGRERRLCGERSTVATMEARSAAIR